MVKAEKANWGGYTPGAFPDNVTKVTKVDDSTVKLTLDAQVLLGLVHLQRAVADHADADGLGRHQRRRQGGQRRLHR